MLLIGFGRKLPITGKEPPRALQEAPDRVGRRCQRRPPAGPAVVRDAADSVEKAVDALVAGRVVAICTERMEYGPRALGNRSILASDDRVDHILTQSGLYSVGEVPDEMAGEAEPLPAFGRVAERSEVGWGDA
jgi:hypothetical protein